MLTFGYNQGLVEGLRAAWGARWIVTQDGGVDHVWDRTSWAGTDEEIAELETWLNEVVPQAFEKAASPFQRARANASRFLKEHTISTREAGPVILHQDSSGAVIANSNGSAGYLYVSAYLFKHLPEGHPTRGLEKVLAHD